MAVRTRVQPLDRDIALILDEALSPAAQSRALASFAEEQLKDAQKINNQALGRVPPHQSYVDGRAGAALESVRPDGTIIFEFELIGDVVEWIEQLLIKHSPERTGRYSRSHVLLADEREVQFGAEIPEAREYVFLNTQPYGRKIEEGLSKQAPVGVYHTVATLAHGRFGNIAKVYFEYRAPFFGAIDAWANKKGATHSGRGRRSSRAERLRRQPAIIVTI